MALNLGSYRLARRAYVNLPPRERVGMTPERLASLVFQEPLVEQRN